MYCGSGVRALPSVPPPSESLICQFCSRRSRREHSGALASVADYLALSLTRRDGCDQQRRLRKLYRRLCRSIRTKFCELTSGHPSRRNWTGYFRLWPQPSGDGSWSRSAWSDPTATCRVGWSCPRYPGPRRWCWRTSGRILSKRRPIWKNCKWTSLINYSSKFISLVLSTHSEHDLQQRGVI